MKGEREGRVDKKSLRLQYGSEKSLGWAKDESLSKK